MAKKSNSYVFHCRNRFADDGKGGTAPCSKLKEDVTMTDDDLPVDGLPKCASCGKELRQVSGSKVPTKGGGGGRGKRARRPKKKSGGKLGLVVAALVVLGVAIYFLIPKGAPALAYLPDQQVDFGEAQLPATTPLIQVISLKNLKTAKKELEISDIQVSGPPGLTITRKPSGPIARGKAQPIELTWTPTAPGPLTASVSFKSNDKKSPQVTIPIVGTATGNGGGGGGTPPQDAPAVILQTFAPLDANNPSLNPAP